MLQQTRAKSHMHFYGTTDDNTSDFILIHLFFSVSPCLRVRTFFLTEIWVTIWFTLYADQATLAGCISSTTPCSS